MEKRSSGLTLMTATSTPLSKAATASALLDPGVSSVTEGSDSQLSGVEPAAGFIPFPGTSGVKRKESEQASRPAKVTRSELLSEGPLIQKKGSLTEGLPVQEKRKTIRVEIDLSSTDLEDFYDVDYDPDDPTYEPEAWHMSIVQESGDELEYGLLGIDEDVFNIESGMEDELPTEPVLEGKQRLTTVNEELMKEDKFIITKGILESLLKLVPGKTCKKCSQKADIKMKNIGCTAVSIWVCANGHEVGRWASSSMLPNGVYATNFQALSCVLISGNNFSKVALFARFLGLMFPARSSFSRIQNKCVVPVVDRYWQNIQASALEEHRAVQVIVSGDGRMDSPGHSAKYCTYTVMNQADKRILAMEVVDKRETGLKSGNMEAKGFGKAMAAIQDEGVQVQEVVTDAHPQISAIMKRTYPHIRHSYDMWHGAKNLGKKLGKIASVKGNESLKLWVKDITNHFFHCAESCDGSVLHMKTKWFSVLNHITNRHSWALGQCDHGPIEEREDKMWLKPSSQAIGDLRQQVMDKRLLRTFPYYITCQTTSELETFNNHLLMYAPKRNAFSYGVYKCRCQLAAIDYSKHIQRRQLVDKDGKPRCRRMHSKAANNWTVVPVKEAKKFLYIPELLRQVAMEYCLGYKEKTLSSKVEVKPTDPVHIAKTIAPHSPPPTEELQERKVARIKGKKSSE